MTNTSCLIDHIQSLNEQRLQSVKGAREDMLMAILELKHQVQLPWNTLWENRFEMFCSIGKRMAIEMGLVQAISDRGGSPVSAKELSAGTRFDQRVIERLLRLLASMRLIDIVGKNVFKANEVTKLLNTKGSTAYDKIFFDWLCPIGANIVSCINETGLPQYPESGQKGPFESAFGVSFYEHIAQQPGLKQNFDLAMSAKRLGLLPQWFHVYPVMEELGTDVLVQSKNVIVDVAGNKGYELVSLADEYPEFGGTMILEDLPSTFAQMSDEERSKIKAAGIIMQDYNFFTPQPIKGADIYFIRDVLHDWPDEKATQLLSHTAEAMEPNRSRVLIEDHVVDDENLHHTAVAKDILMMVTLNGVERTLEQWTVLLKESGLTIVKVWPDGADHPSIIEAVKI
ncbi:MAG: hypothetical protein Q9169_008001 [Polycauliona sp. 2 TL-2023]